MIELKNISFSYGDMVIIENINMKLESGTFLGVLGNNGAGKSTLLKCISGFLKPKGDIIINEKNYKEFSRNEIAQTIAYLEQENSQGNLRVFDTVLLGRRPYIKFFPKEEDIKKTDESIEKIGIKNLRYRFMNELSGGERQKVGLARAVCQEPDILLLDEPTNNLDIKSQHDILNYIKTWTKKENKIAIMIIHDINLALRYCNKFTFISDNNCYCFGDGCVVNKETIKRVFDINVEFFEHKNSKLMDVI